MPSLARWTDPHQYPSPWPDTGLARWHWEFLRRNARYQDDYRRFQALDPDAGRDARERLARRSGLDGIMLDYREAFANLFESPRRAPAVRIVRWDTGYRELDDGSLAECDHDDLSYLDPRLRQHECCAVFNLRDDLQPQIEATLHALRAQQARHAERRGRPEEYLAYLRILDAAADGVPERDIAAVVFFEEPPDRALAMLRDALRAAQRLRDVDYRYL